MSLAVMCVYVCVCMCVYLWVSQNRRHVFWVNSEYQKTYK